MIVETLCSYCHHYFSRVRSPKGGGRAAQYCSARCKQAAYRDRVTFAPVIASRPHLVTPLLIGDQINPNHNHLSGRKGECEVPQ